MPNSRGQSASPCCSTARRPVHTVFEGQPVEPTPIATNKATGERVSAVGTPAKETGHFLLEVTFPSEGEWSWTIEPVPLLGETQFEPLTVLPAVAVAPVKQPVEAGASLSPAATAADGGLALSSFCAGGAAGGPGRRGWWWPRTGGRSPRRTPNPLMTRTASLGATLLVVAGLLLALSFAPWASQEPG